jgi:hypothetical protein
LEARLEDQAQCLLVIIGATPEGNKELVGFTDGMRESAESWRELLLDLRRRGLSTAPEPGADSNHRQANFQSANRTHSPPLARRRPSLYRIEYWAHVGALRDVLNLSH